MQLLPGLPSFDGFLPSDLFQVAEWSWFHLLPGFSDGSAMSFLSAEGQMAAHTVPAAFLSCAILCVLALVARAGLNAARAKGGTLQYVPATNLKPRNVFELIIGGQEVRSGNVEKMVMPHAHGHVMGTLHQEGTAEVRMTIDAAENARPEWEALPWSERAAVLLRAGELLAGPWRDTINAATMLN